jgi:formylmethanofuran dehydrogenase subunit E
MASPASARKAVNALGAEVEFVKVTDYSQIAEYPILSRPGLVVNERVVCSGRMPTEAEATTWPADVLEAPLKSDNCSGIRRSLMDEKQILLDALQFHGHKCWASTAGVRAGLVALRTLGVKRSEAKALHVILENGYYHGAMCFGDGVQYTTGCTFGKGNIEKAAKGKLAMVLIDKERGKAVRIAYRPTLQEKIKVSAFMQKRAAGVPPTDIPEAEQWELVNLVWDAPEEDVLTIGPVTDYEWSEPEEIVRFAVCPKCGELVAEPYMRLVMGEPLCMDCSRYAV